MRRINFKAAATSIVCSSLLLASGPAAVASQAAGPIPVNSSIQANQNATPEDILRRAGVTELESEKAAQEILSSLDELVAQGKISPSDAETVKKSIVPNQRLRALPVWAAGAIVGCAGSVALGEGKDQIKNALKQQKSVDDTTEIVIGSAVDCVFGAVPGGAIAAGVKSFLTKPIKDALRPLIKKVVADMEKRYREGEF